MFFYFLENKRMSQSIISPLGASCDKQLNSHRIPYFPKCWVIYGNPWGLEAQLSQTDWKNNTWLKFQSIGHQTLPTHKSPQANCSTLHDFHAPSSTLGDQPKNLVSLYRYCRKFNFHDKATTRNQFVSIKS